MSLIAKTFFSAFLIFNCITSIALELIQGAVTHVEATYMPSTIPFRINGGSTSCPAGRELVWSKTDQNNKAVYASLLIAMATGKTVAFFINDGDTTCNGQFIHINN